MFLAKLNSSKKSLNERLKEAHLGKGTYSNILNGKTLSKKTLELMTAYLDDRVPKFLETQPSKFYCFSCQENLPEETRAHRWACKPCVYKINRKSKTKTQLKMSTNKNLRSYFLKKKQRNYLNRKYGSLGKCMELILEIKKEYKNER